MSELAQQQRQSHRSHMVSPAKPMRERHHPSHITNPFQTQPQAPGNQTMQRLLQTKMLQAKLTVGQPGDQYEQQADRVAEQVMRMPEPLQKATAITQAPGLHVQRLCPKCEEELHRQPVDEKEEKKEETAQTKPLASQITPLLQRQVEPAEEEEEETPVRTKLLNDVQVQRQEAAPEEEEEEEPLQAKALYGSTPVVTPSVNTQINALRSGGQPLDATTRAFFEPRFGYDFGQVRVHTDARATEAARALNARAFTVGLNVVFGAGQYLPEMTEGKKLLAHELTHVVQQKLAKLQIQRHGNHPTITTPEDKYRHTLQHAGMTQQAKWERGLRNNTTFLGVRISGGIHQELVDRLLSSEAYLRNRPGNRGLSDAQIAQRIGLYSISGRRDPATAVSGRRISYHAFGLAMDVNYRGNPFIARSEIVARIIQRATNLILGRSINIRAVPRNLTLEEVRDLYQKASDALMTYFAFRNDRNALAAQLRRRGLPGDNANVNRWLHRIRADYNNPSLRGEFRMEAGEVRDLAKGFIDLSEELVVALGRFSGLVPEHELTWGGDPRIYRGGKDFMHFDWRNGTVKDRHRI